MTKPRRGLVSVLLLAALMAIGVPAQARYGYTHVDTWARYHHRVAGHNDSAGTLRVRAPVSGSSRRVIWSVENLGAAIPKIHSVTFNGCDDGNGFRFRYRTQSGSDVSGAVTHQGYTAPAQPHERAWLNVRIRSTASGRSFTCVLSGVGNGPASTVKLAVHS